MSESDIRQILVAIARVEGRIDALQARETRLDDAITSQTRRLDKLERIAYVALGMALASGTPQLVGLLA